VGKGASIVVRLRRIAAPPDLDLFDISVGDTLGLEFSGESSGVGVFRVTDQEISFTASKNFEPSKPISGDVSTHANFEFGDDGSNVLWMDVFGCINSESREADGQQVNKEISNSLSDVILAGVQVGETDEPACVEDVGVRPGVQRLFTMEVHGTIRNAGVFEGIILLSVVVVDLIGEGMCVERREVLSSSGVLSGPVGTASTGVSMHLCIVSSASHVVDNSISIDSQPIRAASVDCVTELGAGSHSAFEAVRDRLIHEVPGVEFILHGLDGHEMFLMREKLDAKVAGFSNVLAFKGNVFIWPSEEFDNCAFLSVTEITGTLFQGSDVPNEVDVIELKGFTGSSLNNNLQLAFIRRINHLGWGRLGNSVEIVGERKGFGGLCVNKDSARFVVSRVCLAGISLENIHILEPGFPEGVVSGRSIPLVVLPFLVHVTRRASTG